MGYRLYARFGSLGDAGVGYGIYTHKDTAKTPRQSDGDEWKLVTVHVSMGEKQLVLKRIMYTAANAQHL
jgi:hypothetical protein